MSLVYGLFREKHNISRMGYDILWFNQSVDVMKDVNRWSEGWRVLLPSSLLKNVQDLVLIEKLWVWIFVGWEFGFISCGLRWSLKIGDYIWCYCQKYLKKELFYWRCLVPLYRIIWKWDIGYWLFCITWEKILITCMHWSRNTFLVTWYVYKVQMGAHESAIATSSLQIIKTKSNSERLLIFASVMYSIWGLIPLCICE